MKRTMVVAILMALIVAACTPVPELTSGVVKSKEHFPDHKWVQIVLIPHFTKIGKSSSMSLWPVPIFHHSPEHWAVEIEGTVVIDGKEVARNRTLYVPVGTFDSVSIGDSYTVQVTDGSEEPLEKHNATEDEKRTLGVEPASSEE